MPPALVSITPMIPAGADLDAALQFFTEHMGFSVTWRSGGMAGILRDGIGFTLVENTERLWAENASFSIGVTGLDALYAEYRAIPATVGPLEFKVWGRREFHLILPSGVCLQFFEHQSSGG